jgi:hypothetical protein
MIYPYFGLLKGAKRRSMHIKRRALSSRAILVSKMPALQGMQM